MILKFLLQVATTVATAIINTVNAIMPENRTKCTNR